MALTGWPTAYTAHIDTFARDHLPPADQWPEFRFDRPEYAYPERINCATVLCDDAISEGHGERTAVLAEGTRWTYAELLDRANRIAHVLTRNHGVVPGNRVLLHAPNSPMLVATWVAVIKTGAIAVTTMPLLRAKEIGQVAVKAHIDHALCDNRLVAEVNAAAADTGMLRHVTCWGNGALESCMAQSPGTFLNVETARDDVCLLAFTSGTTGEPKATMHFHRDVLAMAEAVGHHLLDTAPSDIYVGSPPLGFTFGLGALLVFPLRFRAATALIEQPAPDKLLEAVQTFRASCLFTAPTMYRRLRGLVERYDVSSLRASVSAGEPLPRTISDDWHAATGLRLIDGIGATEMIHMFIGAKGKDIRPGATGKPLPGYEAAVLDDDYQPLPRGRSGQLAVRGPTGCRYLADDRQRRYVVNGWNLTGDRYHIDEDGYFWFEARTDDMIVSAGYNIAAPEVESALLEHPAVREVAVVGVPCPERGQIVKGFVVLTEGWQPGPHLAKQLQDFVKQRIAPYKYPRAISFETELPKTAAGKVTRAALRKRGC